MTPALKREAAKFLRWRQEQGTLVDELKEPQRTSFLDMEPAPAVNKGAFRRTWLPKDGWMR